MPPPYIITKIIEKKPADKISFSKVANHYESEICTIKIQTTPKNYGHPVKCKIILRVPTKDSGYIKILTDTPQPEHDFGAIQTTVNHEFKFRLVSEYSMDTLKAILAEIIFLQVATSDYDDNTVNTAPWPTLPFPQWTIK